jgi:hypothetical protein
VPYTGMVELWSFGDSKMTYWEGASVLNWGDEDAMECCCGAESTS